MDVKQLCETTQNYKYEIVTMREKIFKLEDLVKANEKKIWENCDHEWKYDISADEYEKNKYFCKHCKLWRNSYMYR